jgi:miniconductance mechanosensitive channel
VNEIINNWISNQGWNAYWTEFSVTAINIFIIITISYLADIIVKRILLKIVSIIVQRTESDWDDALLNRKVFHRLAYFAPAIVIYLMASSFPSIEDLIQKITGSLMIFIAAITANSILNAVNDIYNRYDISREKPIKGFIQVLMIFLYLLTIIFILSLLLSKSPWVFLSGIGAMTAIILLIFKDSILGLVAGFQLSANKMVRIGDWIEMPKFGADGDVIDVTLNTVKVQNWDKTITTIPTYSLISDSFKNWRGMSDSGGRRIKRSFSIDMNSIKFCDDDLLKRFEKFKSISTYIKSKRDEVIKANQQDGVESSSPADRRNLTNIGTFRAYLYSYLRNHQKIHQNMTLLVRQLPPSTNGLPIEIYVFSNDQEWISYENIQSDIFDHMLAVLPEFDLIAFQNPSGRDFLNLSQDNK